MAILTEPIPLGPNLVPRFYRGGGQLAAFRLAAGYEIPELACEDWVGSVTRAWQPPGEAPSEIGLSRAPDGGRLADLLGLAPGAAPEPELAVLVKLLDAGQRLPIHCHPSRDFAATHLGSAYGKAEAWIVLEAAAGAQVWLGWREPMSRSELVDLIRSQRTAELLGAMAVASVRAGDVVFVPAGVPHAIGPGIICVEVQEPTDFSIVAEWAAFPIDPADAALGRDWDEMVDAFDTEPMPPPRLERLRQVPGAADDLAPGLRAVELLGPDATPFFRATRLDLDGDASWPWRDDYVVAVVLAGVGEARGAAMSVSLGRGVTFAIPPGGGASVSLSGRVLTLVACRPGLEPPA